MPDKQILLEKMRHEKSMSLPILTFPAVQLLGINVRELVEKPEYQARAMHLLTERYPVFAALSMMDLSVEAEAFGAPVRHYDMDIPTVTGPLITSMEAAVALPVPDVKRNRTGKYVEGVRLAKTLIADKPVIAGVIGPFSSETDTSTFSLNGSNSGYSPSTTLTISPSSSIVETISALPERGVVNDPRSLGVPIATFF